MAKIMFEVGGKLDKQSIDQLINQFSQAKKRINEVMKLDQGDFINGKEMIAEIDKVTKAISKSYNESMGRLDTTAFRNELKKVNVDINKLGQNLSNNVDAQGTESFKSLTREIKKAEVQIQSTKTTLDKMFDTFAKTAWWSMANKGVQAIGDSFQRAIGYTKDLDSSLNNIRVVTGMNQEQMDRFAVSANKVARELGKTTTDYTEASLLYLQQGRNMQEAAKLTEATLIGANITGQETAETSELLTAALNGYNLEAEKAMYITDIFANVGAKSGADFRELAVGFSKVASMAKTTGVSVEQLTAQLATISTVTREAPESIGTSLKTIYGRMTELKAGKKDEEGWTMGKVEKTFSKAGLSMVDETTGKMKEVGDVIEEVGRKWTTFNKETQLALTQAMAGSRQQNRLIALFNTWEMYEDQLVNAQNAEGAAMDQNAVRMDSIEAKANQLKTALEEMFDKLNIDDMLKSWIGGLTTLVDKVNDFISALGGIEGVVATIGPLLLGLFSKQLTKAASGSIQQIKGSITDMMESGSSFSKVLGKVPGLEAKELTIEEKEQREADKKAERANKFLGDKGLKEYESIKKNNEARAEELAVLDKVHAKREKAYQDNEREREAASQKLKEKGKEEAALKKEIQLEERLLKLRQEKAQLEKIDAKSRTPEQKEAYKKATTGLKGKGDLKSQKADEATMALQTKAIADKKAALKAVREEQVEYTRAQNAAASVEDKLLSKLNEVEDSYNEVERELEEGTSQINEIDSSLSKIEMGQKIAQGAAGVIVAVSGVVNAMDGYSKSAMDFNGQTDAIVSGFNSVGAGLMLLPGPWAKVAGAAIMAAGQVAKFTRENFGMGEIIKENEALLTSYKERMNDLTAQKQELGNATNALTKAEAMAADGISLEEQEEYNTLVKEAADASPRVVAFYDAFSNAVLKTREEVDDLNKSLDEQIQKTKENMAKNAGGFAAESAYMQTEGLKKKESLEAEIKALESKLEQQYTEGASQKQIGKTQGSLNELYDEMSVLQGRFEELGVKVNDAIVEPFISSEEVFKEMGQSLQGYVGMMFNADEIGKGLSKLDKDGKATTAELKKMSESYMESFKKGILEVGTAFADLNQNALDGDKNAQAITDKLAGLPLDVQKSLSEQLMVLSLAFDQEQINQEVIKIADFIDEQGNLDSFGMVDYFYNQVGPAARDALATNIRDGIADGLQKAKDEGLFDVKGFGGIGSTVGEDLSTSLMNESYRTMGSGEFDAAGYEIPIAMYSESTKQALMDAAAALKEGNMEVVTDILNGNQEVLDIVSAKLAQQGGLNEGWLGQQVTTDYEQASRDILSVVDALVLGKEELFAMNLALGEQDIMMSDMATTMADSVDGLQEMGDLWNQMVGATQSLGEDGLFAVDISAMDDQNEALKESINTIAEATERSDELVASQEELDASSRALGEAFDQMAANLGEDTFGKIASLAGTTADELKSLAEQAKEGSVDAARTLQLEMSKVYAALKKDSTSYYADFKTKNVDRINQIAQTTGIEADKYRNLAEYQDALEEWKARNKVEWLKMDLENVAELLGVTDENYQVSAENTALLAQGQIKDVTGASSAVAMAVGVAALEAGIAAAEGGSNASKVFVNAAKTGDATVDAVLAGIQARLAEDANSIEGAKALVEEYRAKIGEIAASVGATSALKGYQSTGGFNFGGGGTVSIPDYKPTTPPPTSGSDGPGISDGGGGKDKKPKKEQTVDDLEVELDIYHDIEAALKEIGNRLEKLRAIEGDLYGEAKIQNMEQQLALLKEQAKWEQKRIDVSKTEMAKVKEAIGKQGVTFDDSTGIISNYNQILQAKLDAANAIADTDVENKKAAQEEWKKLQSEMERYEDMLQAIYDADKALLKLQDEISSQALKTLDYKIQIELDTTALERQTEEFLIKLGDGLGTTMEKFVNSSERFEKTLTLMKGSMADIASMQKHIAEVQANTDLTPEAKLEELKKSKDEMIKFYEAAIKYRQELEKIKQTAYKEAGKQVSDHLKEFDNINKELKSMMEILKLTGDIRDVELVNSMYELQGKTLDSQLDAAIKSRDMMKDQLSTLEEGTEEWKIMNEEVRKLDEQILKITQESLKLYQDQLKYTVDSVLKDLEKNLTGGNTFKEVDKALKKQDKDKKEYLSTTEKILKFSSLQKKIEEEIAKTTDPAAKKQLQDFLEKDLAMLKEKDKLTHYDIERAEKMLDITMKQIALDNARNNKTMMRLVRTSTGNWAYQYVADAEKVEQAQQDLSNSLADLMEFDQKRQEQVQKDMLEAKKEFYKELEEIMKNALNGEYETQEEFNEAIKKAEEEFGVTMKDLSESLNTVNQNLTESTLATILDAYKNNHSSIGILTKEEEEFFKKLANSTTDIWTTVRDVLDTINQDNSDSFKDKFADIVGEDAEDLFQTLQGTFGDISGEWDNSVMDMITSNENLTEDVSNAVGSLKDAWQEYQDKVQDITDKSNTSLEGMKDRVDSLTQAQDKASASTDKLVDSIEDELDALAAIDFTDLFNQYDDLIEKAEDYIKTLDAMIKKQQEAMGTNSKPPTGGGGTPGGGGGSTGGSGSGGGSGKDLTIGASVKVKSGRTWYHDSGGTAPSGSTTGYAGKNLQITTRRLGAKYEYNVGQRAGEYLGWLKKTDLEGFATGGYTGDWAGKDGRVAMLHQKELILNKDDTQNILEAVRIMRSSLVGVARGNYNTAGRETVIPQEITINAEFPNVRVSSEIEKAFANMPNMAAQYASKRNR